MFGFRKKTPPINQQEKAKEAEIPFLEKVSLSDEFNAKVGNVKNKRLLELFFIIFISSVVFFVTWGQLNTFGADSWIFFVLININAILMLVVLFLVARNVIRLILERKRKVFGARLRTRLVLAFISVTFLPIILMFLATNKILTTSVNYWFTTQVENSMQAALNVGQSFYSSATLRLKANAEILRSKLSQTNIEKWENLIKKNKKENNLVLLGIVSVTYPNYISYQIWDIDPIFNASWKQVSLSINFANASKNGFEPLLWGDDKGDFVITTIPLKGDKDYFIISAEIIGKGVINQLEKISDGFEEYQALKNLKQPLKFSFSLILGLLSLIVLFASVWLAFRLSRELIQPILALSKGTKKIAEGDWTTQVEDKGKDELGNLVDSFNAMAKEVYTSQEKLKMLNKLIETKNENLTERNQYIEAILEHITTGVITLNEDGRLITMNKAACDILQMRAESILGLSARAVLGVKYSSIIDEMYEEINKNPNKTWTKEVEVIHKGQYLKVYMQAVPLRNFMQDVSVGVNNSGYVIYDENLLHGNLIIVLEDITELSQEQRLAAWKEVAKRIAHEIKNPLTPIKLSVERMERKFANKIDDPIFQQCTSLIIKEVNRIQSMVADFSSFSVMPSIDLKKENIIPLLSELLEVFKVSHSRIEWILQTDTTLPDIMLDKKSMHRAIYNILQNAAEAIIASKLADYEGKVLVHVYLVGVEEPLLAIDITDNGKEVDEEELARIFEPYYSKKATGTGLGLAIVHSVITDHQGTITAHRNNNQTTISIRLPIIR